VLGALWLTASLVEVDFVRLAGSLGKMVAFAGHFFMTPDWAYLPQLLDKMLETIEMTVLATAIAIVVSLPLGVLAARNATPHVVVYRVVRDLLSLMRALPELVWALVFVSAVGLGPLPGVMARGAGDGRLHGQVLCRSHRGGRSQARGRCAGARRRLAAGTCFRHAAAGLARFRRHGDVYP